jgi:hypothetical protein
MEGCVTRWSTKPLTPFQSKNPFFDSSAQTPGMRTVTPADAMIMITRPHTTVPDRGFELFFITNHPLLIHVAGVISIKHAIPLSKYLRISGIHKNEWSFFWTGYRP